MLFIISLLANVFLGRMGRLEIAVLLKGSYGSFFLRKADEVVTGVGWVKECGLKVY